MIEKDKLKPNKNIQKFLFSSTANLCGEFATDHFLITQAWPNYSPTTHWHKNSITPAAKNAYMLVFNTEDLSPDPGYEAIYYSGLGELVTSALSLLYGKVFDFHGPIECNGHYHVADQLILGVQRNTNYSFYSQAPRADFQVKLDLSEVGRIYPLLFNDGENKEPKQFKRSLMACCKFYALALQGAEKDPEVSYLHLVTALEILSNTISFNGDQLLDQYALDTIKLVDKCCENSTEIEKFIKDRLRQVKRKFTLTVEKYIDDNFFNRTESQSDITRFKKETFQKCIKSAYDLRSQYVHTGSSFGRRVLKPFCGINSETPLPSKSSSKDSLDRILDYAPSLSGLERVTRYSLLSAAIEHNFFSMLHSKHG